MLCVNLPAHLSNYFKAISFKQYDILAWSSGGDIIACWWLPGLFWVLLTAICIYRPLGPPSSKKFKLILAQIELFICFKYLGSCWVKETAKKLQWNPYAALIEIIRPVRNKVAFLSRCWSGNYVEDHFDSHEHYLVWRKSQKSFWLIGHSQKRGNR